MHTDAKLEKGFSSFQVGSVEFRVKGFPNGAHNPKQPHLQKLRHGYKGPRIHHLYVDEVQAGTKSCVHRGQIRELHTINNGRRSREVCM